MKETFAIPAGKVREYENIFDALRREVWEETGLHITAIHGEENKRFLDVAGNQTIVFSPYCVTQNWKSWSRSRRASF